MRPELISRLALVAILFALLVRAAVPVGWMVKPDDQAGMLTIQLCSGRSIQWSPQTGTDLQGTAEDAEHDDGSSHDTDVPVTSCPFALASLYVAGPETVVIFEPPLYPDLYHVRPPATGPPVKRTASAPLPARGPPISV